MRLLLFLFLSYGFVAQVQAQQYEALRKKYFQFTDNNELDSALHYSFLTKKAASKEQGKSSLAYYRSLNNIGYVYNELHLKDPNKHYADSAKFWWLTTYQAAELTKSTTLNSFKAALYQNLYVTYLMSCPKLDSAIYFADKVIASNRILLAKKPKELLNLIVMHAKGVEEEFNLPAAEKYYQQALAFRKSYFGAYSAVIVKGLDSVLRNNPETDNPLRRGEIYLTLSGSFTYQQLSKKADSKFKAAESQSSITYSAALMDESLKTGGNTSADFHVALNKLANAYHNWLNEDEMANFLARTGLILLQSQGKQHTALFKQFHANRIRFSKTSLLSVKEDKTDSHTVMTDHSSLQKKQKDEPRLMFPIGHPQGIRDAEISPNRKYVYSKSFNDSNVKLWDVATGALLYDLPMDGTISFALFSPNSEFLFAIAGNKGVMWRIIDGTKKWVIDLDIQTAIFSKYDNILFMGDANGYVHIRSVETGKLIKKAKFNDQIVDFLEQDSSSVLLTIKAAKTRESLISYDHSRSISKVLVHNKSFSMVVDGTDFVLIFPENAVIYDLNIKRVRKIIELEPGEKDVSYSQKNNLLLVQYRSDTSRLLYNTKNGEVLSAFNYTYLSGSVQLLTNGKGYITHDNVDAASWSFNSDVVYIFKGESLARINRNVRPFIKITDDQHYLLMVFADNILRLWDMSGSQPNLLREFSGKTRALYSPAVSNDGNYLAANDTEQYVKLVNLSDGKLVGSVEHNGAFYFNIAFSNDSKSLITASDSSIRVWDIPSLKLKKEIIYPQITSLSVSKDDQQLLATSLKNKGELTVFNISTGKALQKLPIDSIMSAKFNSKNSQIAIIDHSGSLSVLDWPSKMKRLQKKLTKINLTADFRCNDQYIVNLSDAEVTIFKAIDGKLVSRFPITNAVQNCGYAITNDGKTIYIGQSNGDLDLYEVVTGKRINHKNIHTAAVVPILTHNDSRLVTSSEDGTVKIWDAKTLLPLFQHIPVSSTDYVIYAPNGYYQSTPDAAKYLHYVTSKLQVIGFDQLDVKYNRPDKVLQATGTADTALLSAYHKAYEKRVKRLGIDTTLFRPGITVPEADFANRAIIAYEQHKDTLTLHIKAIDTAAQLERLHIWINECPMFGVKGLSLKNRRQNALDTTFVIRLTQGRNIIETTAANINGNESYRKPLYVNYTPTVPVKERVWFIGIGIDKFADSTKNLRWSTTDIKNLKDALSKKFPTTLKSTILLNEQVTKENVLALKHLLMDSTTIDDKVILSYSGHGLLSNNLDYYLSSYNVQFDSPEKEGILYDMLENLLDSIPARKKLMLIDACHSGEVDKDELKLAGELKQSLDKKGVKVYNYGTKNKNKHSAFELMQSLFTNVGRNTGAMIISASGGTQYALEKSDLKGGVFTYSILQTMNNTSPIKISAVKKEVIKRVSELTSGLQVPTTRSDFRTNDWELW
jgi:WD40 repeat protein